MLTLIKIKYTHKHVYNMKPKLHNRKKIKNKRKEEKMGALWIWKRKKKSAYSIEKDLWPTTRVVVNSLVRCLFKICFYSWHSVTLHQLPVSKQMFINGSNIMKFMAEATQQLCSKILLQALINTLVPLPGIKL